MADYLHWDTQGPCPDGWHVPTKDDWDYVFSAGVSLGAWASSGGGNEFRDKLKIGLSGLIDPLNGNYYGGRGQFWSSTPVNDLAYCLLTTGDIVGFDNTYRQLIMPIRPFKNTPVKPTSSRTTVHSGSNGAGIFYNASEGLTSISKDGQKWITLSDKNLGALGIEYMGNFYQRGNNYAFSSSGNTTYWERQDASGYGPSNYYSNNKLIILSEYGDWSYVQNDNLRGGVTDLRPEEPTFSYTGLFRYDENDTEYTNPLKPTQTITTAPAGYPAITETVGSYLNRIASGWRTVEGYNFSKICIVNHHGDIEKEVSESYIPTLEDFEDDNSISFLIQFKQERTVKKIKKIMNNGQEYRVDAVPAGGNVGDLLIKEGDGEKWEKPDVGVIGSGVKNMKVLTKTAYNNITNKDSETIYMIGQGATDIILDVTSIFFKEVGESKQVSAYATPSGSINGTLVFSSSDDSTVSVTQDGLITLLKDGKAVVTVRTIDGSISKTINVAYSKIDWDTITKKDMLKADRTLSTIKSPNNIDVIGYIPIYGTTANCNVTGWRTTSSVPDQTLSFGTYADDGAMTSEETTSGTYYSRSVYRADFGLLTRDGASASGYITTYCFSATDRLDYYYNYDNRASGNKVEAVSNNGRYVYVLGRGTGDESRGSGSLHLVRFDTSSKSVESLGNYGSNGAYRYIHDTIYETPTKTRIYGAKYDSTRGGGGYYEIDRATNAVSAYTTLSKEEYDTHVSRVSGMYDNFDNWNLLINYEGTDGVFGGVKVGDGYFKRGWDNKNKEYVFSPSWL